MQFDHYFHILIVVLSCLEIYIWLRLLINCNRKKADYIELYKTVKTELISNIKILEIKAARDYKSQPEPNSPSKNVG